MAEAPVFPISGYEADGSQQHHPFCDYRDAEGVRCTLLAGHRPMVNIPGGHYTAPPALRRSPVVLPNKRVLDRNTGIVYGSLAVYVSHRQP